MTFIRERQGIEPPDRDFIDVKPKPTTTINENIDENRNVRKLEQMDNKVVENHC